MRTPLEEPATTESPPPERAGGPAVVDIVDPGGLLEGSVVAWLSVRVAEAARVLRVGGSIGVRIVDDRAMAEAHERYKGVAGTTDVLTFDLSGGSGALEADLLVCADEARRQAGLRGHAVEREVLLYILHGVLHCLGMDDHDEASAARMHAEEDRVLSAIGVGATFAREASG